MSGAGSLLYNIFEWQAWVMLAVGGLLSFNLLFPTDQPSIPRMLGYAPLPLPHTSACQHRDNVLAYQGSSTP